MFRKNHRFGHKDFSIIFSANPLRDTRRGMGNGSIGSSGENLAATFLKRKGYSVLDTNWRIPGGEIDIVARDPNGTLVFCEVKTLVGHPQDLEPEDNLTRAKLIKMRRAAEAYASRHGEMIRDDAGWRMDVVAIVMGTPPEIRHYENVF